MSLNIRRRAGQAIRMAKQLATGHTNFGTCTICRRWSIFVEYGPWLRDEYRCIRCGSIPRGRALIYALDQYFPDWRRMKLHESSPGSPSSDLLRRECANYSSSQFFPGVPLGTFHNGERCEDLHALTFSDSSFDLVVTQDVFEHVPAPDRAFREVARVLKPGGAHVFTVPLYAGRQSVARARLTEDGSLVRYLPDEFHANPIDPQGALVTTEWGDEIVDFIAKSSGLETSVHHYKNRRLGLDGEFLYVFISQRPNSTEEIANFS